MDFRPLLRAFLTFALLFLLCTPETNAQGVLGRIKKRAEDAAGRAVDRAAGAAADRAAEAASDRAADAAGRAVDGAVGDVGLSGGGGGSRGGIVDFRELKNLLPESFAGMRRTNAEGQSGGAFGIRTSQATGTYEGGGKSVEVKIMDTGTLRGLAGMGMAAWLSAEIDSETETGYERTTRFRDLPAHVKHERGNGYLNSEMTVAVSERFLVTASGDVEPGVVEAALNAVDFAALTALIPPAEEAAAVVDFRALKDLLPASTAGLTRGEASGEKSSALGIEVASAKADYTSGSTRLTLTITDTGTLQGFTGLGHAAWMATQMDRETETGFERTKRFGQHPGYEKFDRSGSEPYSDVQATVAGRFLVQVQGTGDIEQARALLAAVNLDALAALAPSSN